MGLLGLLILLLLSFTQAKSDFTLTLDSCGHKHIDFTHLEDEISIKPLADGRSHMITASATNDFFLIKDTEHEYVCDRYDRIVTTLLFDAQLMELVCPRRITCLMGGGTEVALSLNEHGLFEITSHYPNCEQGVMGSDEVDELQHIRQQHMFR